MKGSVCLAEIKFGSREDKEKGKKKDEQSAIPLHWRLEKYFKDIPADKMKMFKVFYDELVKFNKKVNLISVKTIPYADVIHFSDSILASRIIFNSHKISAINDLGSGNGFPGLVFGILYPEVTVTLVEKDSRKGEFLKHLIDLLKVKNVVVNRTLVELLPESSMTYAMTRGLGPLGKTMIVSSKLFPQGGVFFHLKGEEWATELAQVPAQVCSFW